MLERLQKIISRAGISSRRHAEELIRSGQVRVNGVIVTELGAKADPVHDRVEAMAGKVARVSEQRTYVLLNKPPEIVSTLADPQGRRTVRNLLVGISQRVFPVGRLEYAASGAVFLTNDAKLASRILKASPFLLQTFWIKVKGRLDETQLKSLAHVFQGTIQPTARPACGGQESSESMVRSGSIVCPPLSCSCARNLLKIGHRVEKMKRVKLASLEIETVPEGHYRRLDSGGSGENYARAVDYALKNQKPIS